MVAGEDPPDGHDAVLPGLRLIMLPSDAIMTTTKDAKELAYLYDLFIVPGWREVFDRLVDDELKIPGKIRVLDAGCGTGGFAVDLAAKLGADSEIIGVDESDERLALARGKAEMQKLSNIEFLHGSPAATAQADNAFDLVVGDATMTPPEQIRSVLTELVRVARPGGTIVLKLTTRGSFDEFFSIYWEALHDTGHDDLTPQLESLITERLTISDAETLAKKAGLHRVRCVTRKERFDYADAAAFFSAPLIESSFLDHWMAIVPNEADVRQVSQKLHTIIDREREQMDFDVSIKATLVMGQK